MTPELKRELDVAIAILAEHSQDVREAATLRWRVAVVMMTIMAAVMYTLLEHPTAMSWILKIVAFAVILTILLMHLVWQFRLNARIKDSVKQCIVLDLTIHRLLRCTQISEYKCIRENDPNLSNLSFLGLIVVSTGVATILVWLVYIAPTEAAHERRPQTIVQLGHLNTDSADRALHMIE